MEINLQEERRADYRIFEAAGSHREIGRMTASQAGTAILPAEPLNERQIRYAESCREAVYALYPEIVEEFQGYADGLGIAEERLLWHYTLGVTGGCSAMALRTESGICVGRNYDYFYWENRRHLIVTRPKRGWAHVGMHEGLVGGRFDGMNEKGLFVSFNGAGPHPDPAPRPGMSFHLIVRYLLEKCSDVREAEEALLSLPAKEAKSYFAADPSQAIVAEVHPERRAVRRMDGDYLIVTNHFKHPSMASYASEWPNSVARYGKLEEHALRHQADASQDPLEALKRVFSDHEAPVCGHQDGLATFWSCLADLSQGRIAYSLGAPCRNEYKEFSV
ncbi:C45 family autoproteolytic acyltransferase/hydolase [Cohnella caldifontis]|uniref:C45 family autoproteolytic acyltransferase/hydolase n=1 Tax=Cohnella caldifontis TaxID=3027471 RepID=UPI0023ED7421|nr:C45 family peptidase [Cohnella sp. YIM B05605]